ncbi:MAG: hypothetical protein JWQ50_7024 [Caballeronia mineralivorans]|jgi:hypothetical protein|nr:hypothetical protein [Caballeronia mineralivorans]MEA3102926.1 hypothetical protein [Caballeronia mineralivorans]
MLVYPVAAYPYPGGPPLFIGVGASFIFVDRFHHFNHFHQMDHDHFGVRFGEDFHRRPFPGGGMHVFGGMHGFSEMHGSAGMRRH